MKQKIFSTALKSLAFTLLFILHLTGSASAQDKLDLTPKVNSLPNADGTYLLHNEKGTKLYIIKKGGIIVETFVLDKKGNPIETESTVTELPVNGSSDGQTSARNAGGSSGGNTRETNGGRRNRCVQTCFIIGGRWCCTTACWTE